MIRFNIGHYRDHGLQMQERGIALIRFSHQITTATKLGIGAGTINPTTDYKGRIATICSQNRRDQTGGCGLAMGTGNCNTVTIAHQFGEHLSAAYNRNALGMCRGNLGIFNGDCRGFHHYISADYIGFTVADKHCCARSLQTTNTGTLTNIRTGNFITLIEQDFGDTTHTTAANTDKMNTLDTAHFRWLKVS